MSATTPTSAAAIPQTTPAEATRVDAAELAAMLRLLRDLGDDEWDRPTDCERWDVRDMLAHIVGATDELVRPWRYVRGLLVSRRRYPQLSKLDALNQLQVDERADRSGPQLIDDLDRMVRARLRMRRRVPPPLRRAPVPRGFTLPPGTRMAYVFDVITIRDVWMHRVDISVATGRDLDLGEHDHEVVRQVVADLDTVWDGPPVTLELTGPAGGSWDLGTAPPRGTVRADAVDYLRCLAGRNDAPVLDVDGDTDIRDAALRARVVF